MSLPAVGDIWVYLSASPLLWLTATLLAYAGAHALFLRANANPLVNPVAIAVALLVALLEVSGTPYERYFDGAQFVHFLLGPATVALAVPLYRNIRIVRRAIVPMALALVAGAATAVVSAVAVASLFGASRETLLSIAPKSVTTPIAMGIAQKIGGLPSLTAVFVILTGITGAMIGDAALEPDARCATGGRAATPSASPRTASARRGRFRSTSWPAPSPASPWA